MLKRFIDLCQSENIFSAQKIVIAVSGGADSMALADLLFKARQRFHLEICIAHYEHGLRGQASLDDATFVKKFAENLNVKFFCEHGDVKNFAAENKISIETAARKLRYNFLYRVQAETILMRILRGATSAGLSAMKFTVNSAEYGLLIRPLLRFKKVELENYCSAQGIIPRIDATNFEADATRNKIRLELLPELEKFNPNIVDTLCRLAEVTAEETDFINTETEKVFNSVVKDSKILRGEFVKLHTAIQRAIIKKFLAEVTGNVEDFGFTHFEAVRKVLVNNLTGVQLPHKIRADLRRGKLIISDKNLFTEGI